MRTETFSTSRSIEDLNELISKALNEGRYDEALKLIDRLNENDAPHFFNVNVFMLKGFCMQMRGQSEEALLFVNKALNVIESDTKKCIEKLILEMKEAGLTQEELDFAVQEVMKLIKDGVPEMFLNEISMLRGFVEWSLNHKELAIADFRNGAKSTDLESIYFFKILEKKVGDRILPLELDPSTSSSDETFTLESCIFHGEYQKAIDLLSMDKNENLDQIALCYALMGHYDQAQKTYEMIGFSSTADQEDLLPIPAIISFLKGDLETARQEFKKWPVQDPNFALLFNMPA